MTDPSRRQLIRTGVVAAAGASGLAVAAKLADRYGLVPPDGSGVFGPGDTLTYAAQRLLAGPSLARECTRAQISNPAYVNGKPPRDEAYVRSQADGFAVYMEIESTLFYLGVPAKEINEFMAIIESYRSQVVTA